MDFDSLTVTQAVVAIFSAAISAASAVIIAWQAIQTRRATRAALDAVDIARDELAQSKLLRDDALKAHIDTEMPRVTVTARVQGQPCDPRDPSVVMIFDDEDRRQTWTQETYVLPRDSGMQLRLAGVITVINDGPRHMQGRYRIAGDQARPGELVDVSPGQTVEMRFSRTESVERWAEIARFHEGDLDADAHEIVVFQMAYRFPGWVGAVDDYEVVMGGTVLTRDESNASGWNPIDMRRPDGVPGRISVESQPFRRSYFRNRPDDAEMNWF